MSTEKIIRVEKVEISKKGLALLTRFHREDLRDLKQGHLTEKMVYDDTTEGRLALIDLVNCSSFEFDSYRCLFIRAKGKKAVEAFKRIN